MKTKTWAIALMFFCTFVTASAQISWKLGVNKLQPGSILNLGILVGFVLYGIGAVILLICLKHGELSVIYPLIALSFIWVNLLSPRFFPTDSMNILKWVGIAFIIGGVTFVGLGSKQ